MTVAALDAARALVRGAARPVVLTGAGVSAESGVPTFRGAGGLWRNRRALELATPEAFARDPALVWEWYEERRGHLATCAPNAAHRALAAWESHLASRGGSLPLLTQNVDRLHQAAGSRAVVELHGSIWVLRCAACDSAREDRTHPLPQRPPRCARCGALERPGVVWFGEPLPTDALAAAEDALEVCDLLLVVGTSGAVYPAAGFAPLVRARGGRVILVGPEATELAPFADLELRAPAGEVLPALLPGD